MSHGYRIVLSSLLIVLASCSHAPAPVGAEMKAPGGPQPLVRSDYSTGEIKTLCQKSMDQVVARLGDFVGQAGGSTASLGFDKSIGLFEEITADFADQVTPLIFMGSVSKEKSLRDEASACEEEVGKLNVEIFSRKDIYNVVARSEAKSTDQKRLFSETMRGFKQGGLELPDDQLAQLRELKKQIATLQTQFSKNLNEDKTTVSYSAEELNGCSTDFLNRHKKGVDGKYTIFANEADYPYLMENAKNPKTRETMALAYNTRAPANTDLIQKTILLREQAAKLLKYKSWADVQIDGRMAENSQHVFDLLNSLKSKLAIANKSDIQILLQAKKKMEDPKATEIKPWDVSYFANQIKKTKYSVDDEVVRTYFPKDIVVAGLFQVYSTLLGVDFEEVPNTPVWSPDVKLFAIKDKKDHAIIGYFYTDFFPREGKYGHAASFSIIAGRMLKTGTYSKPVSAIVSNFTPPSAGKPALLSHYEVEVIFHEFGHIMHQTLTTAPYASLSGSNVAQDFVEAPSQMLENWVWEPTILNLMSGNYKNPAEKLPPDLLKKMIAARDFNQGYFYTRQLLFALTDMEMHTAPGAVDVVQLFDQNYKSILGLEPLKGGHFIGTFGHLMGGYDAGYYGYLWSEVYAADMFTIFHQGGVLNPKIGARYRHTILENGRMKDPNVLLTAFLERKPNNKAFYKKLHIK